MATQKQMQVVADPDQFMHQHQFLDGLERYF